MNPLTQSKNTTILPVLIALTLGCFALSPHARAVCQEGCLTNQNTVLGEDALISDTTGDNNTAMGFEVLQANTTGHDNMAIGYHALRFNTSGIFNTATGFEALQRNTIGGGNTANGLAALTLNTTGNSNTAIGAGALQFNTTGRNNIAVGFAAGNLTTANNNIEIGNAGVEGESRTIRIGTELTHSNTFIVGISGVTVPAGVGVIVDTNGHLGTVVSAARFKDEIKPMEEASEAILALKPVTFRYKKELDPAGISQFGLVAEEVEKVNPDLVARDQNGKPYTVRYEAVNAMLLNEFLKEHRKVEEQQATIAQLKAADARQEEKISALTELVKAQAAQIQKVSAQLEVNKTASQIVLNNQ
jgi:Chaperone of endosialidase